MRVCRAFSCKNWFLSALCLSTFTGFGVTLDDLRRDSELSPERFAGYFKHFKYYFRAEVQSPEIFLRTKSGDCDDYSTLAAAVLKDKGYTPRLVAVRTKKIVHVVCYIEESKGYLDYNFRQRGDHSLIKSGSSLTEIADSVAASLSGPWTSVSEFTYSNETKWLVQTLFPASLPEGQLVAR